MTSGEAGSFQLMAFSGPEVKQGTRQQDSKLGSVCENCSRFDNQGRRCKSLYGPGLLSGRGLTWVGAAEKRQWHLSRGT